MEGRRETGGGEQEDDGALEDCGFQKGATRSMEPNADSWLASEAFGDFVQNHELNKTGGRNPMQVEEWVRMMDAEWET